MKGVQDVALYKDSEDIQRSEQGRFGESREAASSDSSKR